jgi:hypothetical protein
MQAIRFGLVVRFGPACLTDRGGGFNIRQSIATQNSIQNIRVRLSENQKPGTDSRMVRELALEEMDRSNVQKGKNQ